MLSESTARLVENAAVLGEPELVRIKGADQPVRARQLLAIGERRPLRRTESELVGRSGNSTRSLRSSMRRSAAPAVSSPSSDRRVSARADWSANPPRSPPAAAWR